MSIQGFPAADGSGFKMKLESRVCLEQIVGAEVANDYGKRFSSLDELACHLNASDFAFAEGPDGMLRAAFHLNTLLSKERISKKSPINKTSQLANFVRPDLKYLNYEKLIAVAMSRDGVPLATETIATGSYRSASVDVAGSFKAAIACSAAEIALAHNHPSGRLEPSAEDIEITHEFIEAGDILGIPVVDHVIIGRNRIKDGRDYFSIISLDEFS